MAYDGARGVTIVFGTAWENKTWEWNGTNWSQRLTANEPGIMYDHIMVYDREREVAVLFGGYWSYLYGDEITKIWYGQTWEYDAVSEQDPNLDGQKIFLPLILN